VVSVDEVDLRVGAVLRPRIAHPRLFELVSL
jgi:hypothetical protein